jgi:3',5'-cyclic AMP phosphodiesterase CpdA
VRTQTLAHLSDLHLGRSPEHDCQVERLRDAVEAAQIDHVVVTGDVTHRGRRAELDSFHALFAPLMGAGRLSVVPGNHDRLGDDVGARLMRGGRVEVQSRDGLYVVRVDSTGPHNRFLLAGHGELCERVLDLVDLALEGAPRRSLVALVLHHHPVPLPEETLPDRLAARLGWPYAAELRLGAALLARVRGRCDLVLHGHRHVPREVRLFDGEARPLAVFNAGCSPTLGRFRVLSHTRGALVAPPFWLDAAPGVVELATGTEGPW